MTLQEIFTLAARTAVFDEMGFGLIFVVTRRELEKAAEESGYVINNNWREAAEYEAARNGFKLGFRGEYVDISPARPYVINGKTRPD